MTKSKFLIAFIVLSLIFCCTSNSDDGTDPGNANPDIYLRYNVNGNDREYLTNEITIDSRSDGIDIIATKTTNGVDTEEMIMGIPVNYSAAAHQISGASGLPEEYHIFYASDVTTGIHFPTATTGTIVISSINNGYIEGTFNYTGGHHGQPSVTVTNGSFRILIN